MGARGVCRIQQRTEEHRGRGNSSVNEHEGLTYDSQIPHQIAQMWRCIFVIPALGRQRRVDLWGSLAGQPSLVVKFQIWPLGKIHISKTEIENDIGRYLALGLWALGTYTQRKAIYMVHKTLPASSASFALPGQGMVGK